MSLFLSIILRNVLWSALLAVAVFAIGRWSFFWRRPAFMHLLWFGVLLRLIIPTVVAIPLLPSSSVKIRFEVDFSNPISKSLSLNVVPVEIPSTPVIIPQTVSIAQSAKRISLTTIFQALSVIGTVVLLIISGIRYRLLTRVIANSTPAPDWLTDRARRVAAKLEVSRPPSIALSDNVASPAIVMTWRDARILLPRHLAGEFEQVQSDCVMAHELAHLKRHDHWMNLIAGAIVYLFWWNPVSWWAWREMRICQEASCDAIALSEHPSSRRQYAEALLRVVESWNRPDVSHSRVSLGFGQQSALTRRFEMIANPSVRKQTSFAAILSLTALSLTFFCAAVRAEKKEVPAEQKEVVLKYDDGKADGMKSIAGTGEMIQFELPEGNYKLKSLRLHCGRYGMPKAPNEDVEFTIVSEDEMTVIHSEQVPYSTFKRGECRWTTIAFKKPVTVPQKFWVIVDFNAEQTKGVYLSFDTSTGGKYSKIGVPGGESKPVNTKGDWMIQAIAVKD